MEELAKLMPEKNLPATDSTTLVICGVSKSLFSNWITIEPKLRDFIPPVFKMFKQNLNLFELIFQCQQKMALESNNEAILCKVFSMTLTGLALIWFH